MRTEHADSPPESGGLQPAKEAGAEIAVSVLVPVRNEQRRIHKAIEGMRAQRFDGAVEFLLLDGGSTDSTLTELSRLVGDDHRFRVVRAEGRNIPQRLNLGLRLARGEVIARMDAHAIFPAAYLADGVIRLGRGDVASVSGPQIAAGDGPWSRWIAIAMRSWLGRGGARFRHVADGEIEIESGYCGLWHRSLLLAHGGWDERAWKGEDTEFAARITRSGGRIICVPQMAARYLPRESLPQLARQYWNYAYLRTWIARRHPLVLRRSHVLPPAAVLLVVCAAAAPPKVAAPARRALFVYACVLMLESVRIAREEHPSDLLALPAVFATMHLAWGVGFWASCLRHGPPREALTRQFRWRR